MTPTTTTEGHRANDAPRAQTLTNTLDFASADAGGKAFCNMQALAALRGFTLHELSDGSFLLGRWNLCRALPDLGAVAVLLRRIGALQ